jgi:hypothetical protein
MEEPLFQLTITARDGTARASTRFPNFEQMNAGEIGHALGLAERSLATQQASVRDSLAKRSAAAVEQFDQGRREALNDASVDRACLLVMPEQPKRTAGDC